MNMSKRLIIVLCISLMLTASSNRGQTVNQSVDLLNSPAKGSNLKNVMVGQAVVNALINAGAPGGVATVYDCSPPATYSFTPRDSSLNGVLDSIVSADPRYRWEVRDRLINVLPRSGLPPFFAVRIPKFEISGAKTPNEALFQLLAIPEVRQAQLNLGRHAVQGGVYPFCPQGCLGKNTKEISVSLKDVTVREALNAIARADGSAVWRFSRWECSGRKSFSLDFAGR